MLRLPLEIENTTTSGINTKRSGLGSYDVRNANVDHQQLITLSNGAQFAFSGEKMISRNTIELLTHGSNELENSQSKSRSFIAVTARKFLKIFSCFRLGSGQQNDKDSKDLPNIFVEGEENPFFPVFDGRSGDHFSNKVTAELVHQKTSNKTEDIEMSNSPSMIVSVSSQVSRLDRRREKILTNVI